MNKDRAQLEATGPYSQELIFDDVGIWEGTTDHLIYYFRELKDIDKISGNNTTFHRIPFDGDGAEPMDES